MSDKVKSFYQIPEHLRDEIILNVTPENYLKLVSIIDISRNSSLKSKYLKKWKKYFDLRKKLFYEINQILSRDISESSQNNEVNINNNLNWTLLTEIGESGYFDLIQTYHDINQKKSQITDLDDHNYLEPILIGAALGGNIEIFDWGISKYNSEEVNLLFPLFMRKAISQGQIEMIKHLYQKYPYFKEDLKDNSKNYLNDLFQGSIANGDFILFEDLFKKIKIEELNQLSKERLIKYLYSFGNNNFNLEIIKVLDQIGNLDYQDYLDLLNKNSYDINMIKHLLSILYQKNKKPINPGSESISESISKSISESISKSISKFDRLIPDLELSNIIDTIIDYKRLESFQFLFEKFNLWNDPVYFNYDNFGVDNLEYTSILDPIQIGYRLVDSEDLRFLKYFLENFDPENRIPSNQLIEYINRLLSYASGISNFPEEDEIVGFLIHKLKLLSERFT